MNKLLRDERWRILPGQPALNPGGRPRMQKEIRGAIQQTGEKTAERMAALLNDDDAFGPGAWMAPSIQIRLLEVAMERAYGKAAIVRAGASGDESVANRDDMNRRLREIYDSADFPKLRNAKPAGGG
jgi:hypothetical protein